MPRGALAGCWATGGGIAAGSAAGGSCANAGAATTQQTATETNDDTIPDMIRDMTLSSWLGAGSFDDDRGRAQVPRQSSARTRNSAPMHYGAAANWVEKTYTPAPPARSAQGCP